DQAVKGHARDHAGNGGGQDRRMQPLPEGRFGAVESFFQREGFFIPVARGGVHGFFLVGRRQEERRGGNVFGVVIEAVFVDAVEKGREAVVIALGDGI